MKTMDYKKLDAWNLTMELVIDIYKIAKLYPKEEMYALTSQTKRAAISIPANIAEGIGRNYKKDTIQFLHIARGSLYELDTLLLLAIQVEIINKKDIEEIMNKLEKCKQVLNGLINYYEKSNLK
jgi:four helix bundle protein